MSVRCLELHASRDDPWRFTLVPRQERASCAPVDDQDLAPLESMRPNRRVDRDVASTLERHVDGHGVQGKITPPRSLCVRRLEGGATTLELLERLRQRVLPWDHGEVPSRESDARLRLALSPEGGSPSCLWGSGPDGPRPGGVGHPGNRPEMIPKCNVRISAPARSPEQPATSDWRVFLPGLRPVLGTASHLRSCSRT